MRNNFSKRSAAVLFCALAMTLLAAPGSAQDRPVVGAAGITYNPAIDYERVVLTLSGMGRVWQQSVDERGPVIFDLAGPDGELLRDGDYTWEMRIVPRNDGGAERGDAAGAGFGSRRGIPGLVHSGYFMIVGGQLAPLHPAGELLLDGCHRGLEDCRVDIAQPHVVTGQAGDGGDAVAHGSCAHDQDRLVAHRTGLL